MAAGRVCTGFSYPYVAKYATSSSGVSYSNGMELARGVSVSMEASSADDNNFYANNRTAESEAGKFNSGTVTLTVDGLKDAVSKLILGLPDADTNDFIAYGDEMVIPYVGLGFVARFQSDGVTCWVPIILPKVRFTDPALDAATQEETIEWQTQELSASVERDDTTNHNWKYAGEECTTEAAAVTKIKTFLNIT